MNTLATAALVCSAAWGLCVWLLGRTIYRVGYDQGARDQQRNDADNEAYEFVEVDEDHFREIVQQFQEDVRKQKARSN